MKQSDVKNSLMEQLAGKGANVSHFEDMVNDYMKFWKTKNLLQKDINSRGVMYEDLSSVGVKVQKNNPSVKELVMVNRQMLQILKDLDLNTGNVGGGDDDDL